MPKNLSIPNEFEIQNLIDQALIYRKSKGFVPITFDTLANRIAALSSEAYELEIAIERARLDERKYEFSGTPIEFTEYDVALEVADLMLYTVTMLYDLYELDWSLRTTYYQGAQQYDSPEKITQQLRKHIDDVYRAWRKGDKGNVKIALELLFVSAAHVLSTVAAHGWRPATVMQYKLNASIDRPMLHGGKDPRT